LRMATPGRISELGSYLDMNHCNWCDGNGCNGGIGNDCNPDGVEWEQYGNDVADRLLQILSENKGIADKIKKQSNSIFTSGK